MTVRERLLSNTASQSQTPVDHMACTDGLS
jgi:hypothetical protein